LDGVQTGLGAGVGGELAGGGEAGRVDVGGDDVAALGEYAQDGGLADAGACSGDQDTAVVVTVYGSAPVSGG
jgi:hypothetical protein